MTKKELTAAVDTAKAEVQSALQTVYDALNSGQKKKILQNSSVKALFDRYRVDISQ